MATTGQTLSAPAPQHVDNSQKWRVLLLLSLAELLVMAVWFSASAVIPALTELWSLGDSGQSWLTMSVQVGFVVGAFGSAVLNLADQIPARKLFAVTGVLAAATTALIPLIADGLATAVVLRFLTGVFLAGAYPVGMKIMATWTKHDRGLGIGMLVGALTLGSASPHLLKAFGGVGGNWQPVMFLAAGLALSGAALAALFVDEGPYRTTSPPFNLKYIKKSLTQHDLLMSNVGYLGHMWELYAMWTWIPVFLLASFRLSGVASSEVWASVAAFAIMGAGAVGSLLAGKLADRLGRTTITIASMAVSGAAAILIGRFFGGDPLLLTALALIWGFAVVADSAQFSACISELCETEYTGTVLTLQTSLGFLLTLVSIRLIPVLQQAVGWEWAFAFLALGPAVGIWAMQVLRRAPSAVQLAGGNR